MKNLNHISHASKSAVPPFSLNRRFLMKWLAAAAVSGGLGGVQAFAQSQQNAKALPSSQAKPPRQSVYIAPGARRHGKFAQIAFKMTSEDTDGLLGSTELILEPGIIGAVPHLHRGFDEICRVLEGTVHIMVDNQVTAVPAGGWHLRQRGLIHAFWNVGP